LVYGAEVVLPTNVKFGSPRVLTFDEIRQEDLIKDRLLQLEEARCQAALRAARYHKDYTATIAAMFEQGLWRSATWC
jgi:hypothetical protein